LFEGLIEDLGKKTK